MAILADRESQLLIDGKLVAGSAGTFPTVNPATEEVLGVAADADADDMGRAIDAARRAFDETDWSTQRRAAGAVPAPAARGAARTHRRTARDHHRRGRARRGCSRRRRSSTGRSTTWLLRPTPPSPTSGATDLGIASPMGIPTQRTIAREAVGVVGAITPWNFPHQINLAKLGPGAGGRQHRGAQAGARHPVVRGGARRAHRRAHRHPAGRRQHRHLAATTASARCCRRTRGSTWSRSPGRPPPGARSWPTPPPRSRRCSSSSAASRRSSCSTTPTWRARARCRRSPRRMHAGQGCAITTRLVVPRARYDEAVEVAARHDGARSSAGDPTDAGTICGPVISARQRDRVAGLPATRRSRRAARSPAAAAVRADQRHGLLHRADRHRRARQRRPGRPRGDLRPGARRSSPHDGDDDAVRIANDSPYGLSGAVFGADPERAAGGRARGCAPAPSASTAASGTPPTCRSAATSSPASAARWAWPASRSTSRPRPSPPRVDWTDAEGMSGSHGISSRTRSRSSPVRAGHRPGVRRGAGRARAPRSWSPTSTPRARRGSPSRSRPTAAPRSACAVDVSDPDVGQGDGRRGTLAEFGGIDYLVNNAAIFGGDEARLPDHRRLGLLQEVHEREPRRRAGGAPARCYPQDGQARRRRDRQPVLDRGVAVLRTSTAWPRSASTA